MAGDWAGWLLLCITYLLIFTCKEARKSSTVFAAIFLILSIHHAVSIYNAYIGSTIGSSDDAQAFVKTAMIISQDLQNWNFTVGAPFYRFFLACFYKLLGASIFLSQELSIFAFLLSCFVFIKIYKLLGYHKYIGFLLILFGSLPSMVFLGSITLRESWLILFFMLTMYFCLSYLKQRNLYSLFGYIISSVILALFHEALVLFMFLLFGVMVIWQLVELCSRFSFLHFSRLFLNIFFTMIVVSVSYFVLQYILKNARELEAFHSITEGNPLNFVEQFRAYGTYANAHARANYGVILNTSSIVNLFLTFFPTYIYFLFAPFPYQISHILDVYAFTEATLRFFLITSAIITLKRADGIQKRLILFLLIIYFLMSALWSLGTMNYGTSIRHNLMSYWILVLLLGANLDYISGYKYLFKPKALEN